jgi:uncharacterized protein
LGVPSHIATETAAPRLTGIRLHPIKSLDPVSVTQARIGPGGGLELDRAWALYSVDGRWVNGKRTAAMHLIRAEFAPDVSSVTLSVPGDRRQIPARTFAFPGAAEDAAEWFSVYFEQQIIVRYSPEGFPDDSIANGPTIVSRASLQRVAEWFPPLDVDQIRQRFRTTLEIDVEHDVVGARLSASQSSGASAVNMPSNGTLPPFWEDRLFGAEERSVVRFRIGEVHFEGSNPCARCPVPSRDPRTGVEFNIGQSSVVVAQHAAPGSSVPKISSFQKRFTELRQAQLPPWAPAERFDHYYRLATNTRVASTEAGQLLRLGDSLILA